MRRPRNMDFTCPACGARYERLVETREADGAPLASEFCDVVAGGLVAPDAIGDPRTLPRGGYANCGAELEAVDPVLLAPIVRDGRTALDRCKS